MPLTRPPVLPVWADTGDKTQPTDLEIAAGWPVTSIPPSRQRFNWFFNWASNAVRYFSRRSVSDWISTETFEIGDIQRSLVDGKTYRSMVAANINFEPSVSPTKWERWGFTLAEMFVALFSPARQATYTASGSFTVPANVTKVYLSAAGGGGGGAAYGAAGVSGGGGGGSGASCLKAAVTVTPGQVIPITIGAAGIGGVSIGDNGAQGGTTSFGSILSLGGGFGGLSAASGGDGGLSVGTILSGLLAQGQAGVRYNKSSGQVTGGDGGSCIFGRGGVEQGNTGSDGIPPVGPGGGGAGGATGGGATGKAGFITIEW